MIRLRAAALVLWTASGISAAELTADQWRADLAFLAKELPQRHKNLYHTLPKAEFDRRLQELSAAVPRLSELEVRAGITRLLAAVGDSHTATGLESERTLDLSFLEFPEGLYVIGGAKAYEEAIGTKVTAIDGVPVAEVRKRLIEFVAMENHFAAQSYVAWIPNVAALEAAHILRAPERAELSLEKDGWKYPLTVRTRPAAGPRPEWAIPRTPPSWQLRGKTAYWWQYLAEEKALYIQYNSCTEMASLSFRTFTQEVISQAASEAPEKVIIDLRNNPGGNSEVARPLFEAMHAHVELRPAGGVYVLVGMGTFSSGLLNAIGLREEFHAFVAGEPPPARPNWYGNMQMFRLPNSHLAISYSTRYFTPLDDNPPALMPELNQPVSAADYFAGRDALLEAVLKLPASIEKNFEDVIARNRRSQRAYAALAHLYEDRGRDGDAEILLKKGLAANPSSPLLAIALAHHYLRLKKISQARTALAGVSTSSALCTLGRLNLAEAQYAAAEAAFRRCYRLQPDDFRGLAGVAEVYARQNKASAAIRIWDEEAARTPDNVELRVAAGRFAGSVGKFDVAAAEYEQALAQPSGRQRVEIWIDLSEIYRRKGDAAAALRAFDSACEALTAALESMNIDRAYIVGPLRVHYEEALRREPNDPALQQIAEKIAALPAK
jgi:Tfp pilus assembly protein PilF